MMLHVPTEKTKLLNPQFQGACAEEDGVTPYTYLGSQFSTRFGDNFFDAIISKVFLDSNYCCNRHGIYEISVRQGQNSWVVEKRFRDFYTLYKTIQQTQSQVLSAIGHRNIEFPKKPYFVFPWVSSEPSFLEDRKEKLQIFIVRLLTVMSESQSIKFGTPVAQFLDLKRCRSR